MHIKVSYTDAKSKSKNENLLGFAVATFDNSIHVKDIAVFKSGNGISLAMPNYETGKTTNSGYPERKDYFYPITKEARDNLTDLVAAAMESPDSYIYQNDKKRAGFTITTHQFIREENNLAGFVNVKLGKEYAFDCPIRINKNGNLMVSYPGKSYQKDGKTGFEKFVTPTKEKEGLVTATIIKEFKANQVKIEKKLYRLIWPLICKNIGNSLKSSALAVDFKLFYVM